MNWFRLVQLVMWTAKGMLLISLYRALFHPLDKRPLLSFLTCLFIGCGGLTIWVIYQIPFWAIALLDLFIIGTNLCDMESKEKGSRENFIRLWCLCLIFESSWALGMQLSLSFFNRLLDQQGSILYEVLAISVVLVWCYYLTSLMSKNLFKLDVREVILLFIPVSLVTLFFSQMSASMPILWRIPSILVYTILLGFYAKIMNDWIQSQHQHQKAEYYQMADDHLRKQQEQMQQEQDALRTLRHSMKGHLLVLQALEKNNQREELKTYLENLSGQIAFQSERSYASSPILNALLNEYVQSHPKLAFDIEITDSDSLDELAIPLTEIVFLLLDNACDELERHPSLNPCISLNISNSQEIVRLAILNDSFQKKSLHSEKGNDNHGIGLFRVFELVRQLKGQIQIEQTNGFQVQIEIPVCKAGSK